MLVKPHMTCRQRATAIASFPFLLALLLSHRCHSVGSCAEGSYFLLGPTQQTHTFLHVKRYIHAERGGHAGGAYIDDLIDDLDNSISTKIFSQASLKRLLLLSLLPASHIYSTVHS